MTVHACNDFDRQPGLVAPEPAEDVLEFLSLRYVAAATTKTQDLFDEEKFEQFVEEYYATDH